MGFNLDDMMGKYKDFARGYLFYARVNPPGGVSINSDHPYLVSSSQLPTQSIEAITTNWQGYDYKIGGVNSYETLDITFKSDTGQDLRREFLNWMHTIHNPVSNIHGLPGTQGAGAYFGDVKLSQLNGNGDSVMNYQLVDAFPSGIGEVSLDYGTKEISTFTVTFTYQYHIIDGVGGQSVADVEV